MREKRRKGETEIDKEEREKQRKIERNRYR